MAEADAARALLQHAEILRVMREALTALGSGHGFHRAYDLLSACLAEIDGNAP